MEQSHTQFVASIPETYHRRLGPVLFGPGARDLALRLPEPPPRRVLELACGTGVLTRELRAILPPSSSLTAIDLNEPMIEFAKAQPDGAWPVDWRVANMVSLPFSDAAFDAVVCQHGFMFVEEKPSAVREAYRVLEPGGLLLFNVWDAMERNRFAHVTHETLRRLYPVDPPSFYETPFTMHDLNAVGALLQRGGFVEVTAHRAHLRSEAASAADLARGLIEGNPVLLAIRERDTLPVERVVQELEGAIRRELGSEPVPLDLNVIVFSARKVKK